MMATLFKASTSAALIGATASLTAASAQDAWHGIDLAPPPGESAPVAPPAPAKLDVPEPDWTLLDSSRVPTVNATPREQRATAKAGSAWTGQKNADGSSAVSVKQALLPFWDTRVGADLNVASPPSAYSAADAYRNQFGNGSTPSTSGGSAWAAMTAPGIGSIWDKTAIEARVDSLADQSKLGTTFSKSVPLAGNQYSLTLQNGYNVIQQGSVPVIGFNGRATRSYETDQLAKLSIADSGTSLIAGQTLATTDDKWLRTVGAEQKLFGGVNITGTISETLQGPANKSLTAGFKHSW
ncbi:MAG: hypothetical protein JWQ94_1930 [Tardiphaga sp.]|nr:hypothetical protein [Tardiphaga sp.]